MSENKNGNLAQCPEEAVGFLESSSGLNSTSSTKKGTSDKISNVDGIEESLSADEEKCENRNVDREVVNGDPVLLELQKVEEGDIKQPNKTRCVWCRKYVGLLLILLSGVMLTLSSIVVKKLRDYHPFAQAAYRFLGIFLPSIPVLIWRTRAQGDNVFRAIWPLTDSRKRKRVILLILRGAVGCTALLSFFCSLKYLSVADALAIGSCNPVFVAFVAHTFINEKCKIFPVIVVLITITGICILARPSVFNADSHYSTDTLIGVSFASASMLMATFSILIVRFLKRVHIALITTTYGAIGILTNVAGALTIGAVLIPENMTHFLLALALATLTFLGQLCFTTALKCQQSGPVSVIRSSNFLFAFLWQFLLLGILPDLYSIVGASIIMVALAMTAFHKWIATLPMDNSCRKTFSFVLR